MIDKVYEVIFTCPRADYYWVKESGLTFKDAERIAEIKSKYELIHKYDGCCRHYVQPMADEEY